MSIGPASDPGMFEGEHALTDDQRAAMPVRQSASGPYGKREEETEYSVLVNGTLSTIDARHVYATTDKREAWSLGEMIRETRPDATVEIIHRRVVRERWYVTTPWADSTIELDPTGDTRSDHDEQGYV